MASVDLIADVPPSTAPPSVRAGAGRLAASQGFQFVVRLGTSLVLARLLDPRDFGLLGLVSVLVVLLQRTLGDGGMVNALVQRERVSRELASTVFFFNLLVGAVTTSVLVAAAPWISRALGDEDATGVLRGIALSFLLAAFAKVPEAMLRRSMQFGRVAMFGSTNALVTAAVAIPLAVAGHGVASMVIGQVVAVGVEAVLAWVLSGWRPMACFRRSELRKVTSFARNIAAFNLVNYFADAGDKFVVGRFVGTSALGLYSLPYRLLFAPVFAVAQVYRDLLFPVFSRNQHDDGAISRTYLRAVGAMSLVTFPLCALAAVLGQPLVDAGLGERWHEAGPILSVMAVVALLQSVLVTGGIILSAKDRTDVLLRWGLGAGLTMFASYAVGALWGAMGVAVAFLLSTAVLAYPAMKLPFRELSLPVRRLVVALLPAGAVTAVLAGAAFVTRVALEARGAADLTVAAAGTLAGAAGYLAALAWLRPDAVDDLLSMLKKRRTP
jgi:O-antigen/teichoic acid export membrane protein